MRPGACVLWGMSFGINTTWLLIRPWGGTLCTSGPTSLDPNRVGKGNSSQAENRTGFSFAGCHLRERSGGSRGPQTPGRHLLKVRRMCRHRAQSTQGVAGVGKAWGSPRVVARQALGGREEGQDRVMERALEIAQGLR